MDIHLTSDRLDDALAHPMVRGLLESVSDGAIVIDVATRNVVALNQRARDLLDYHEDQGVACQCRRIMNAPQCTSSCPLDRLLEGRPGRPAEVELYYRGRSSVLHARTRLILLRAPSGAPIGALELFRSLDRARHLEDAQAARRSHGIIGDSEATRQLFELAQQVAPHDIPVLITGESGVGKERFADALHALSGRASGPLIKVNCAALSPTLIESELFGHVKGAFTGAHAERRGRFEAADGGTLMLDEVGELTPEVQVKLLRVLQEGVIERVGEDQPRRVDVRVIAATNRDLAELVRDGVFRQDLYFRLLGAELHIPPLRERPRDISPLADHFLVRLDVGVALSDEARAQLLERDWPGNVRELESVLNLAAIRAASSGVIGPEHLRPSPALGPQDEELPWDLATLEAMALDRALERTGGNLTAAASLLGIDRTTLWRKLRKRA